MTEPCIECGAETPITDATECTSCGERICEDCVAEGLCPECQGDWG